MGADKSADRIQLARYVSRRRFIQGSMGAVAGAGAALGTGLWQPVFADDETRRSTAVPLPIPHRTFLPISPTSEASIGVHFYFPGPVSGRAHPSDQTGPNGHPPSGNHPEGRDPSTITNFNGIIGQFDGTFKGKGKDTTTGTKVDYKFHTDTRFMSGEFIGSDERRHRGTFAFIWIDSVTGSLGPHSYDPAISTSLVLWTTEVPDGSAHVDLNEGEGVLHFHNLSTIFDGFTVPSTFDTGHPLGFVGATIDSLRIHWHGAPPVKPPPGDDTPPSTANFSGKFVETSATVELEIRTPATKPPFTPSPRHGFEFVADPSTTETEFAQIGHERNGLLK